MNITNWDSIIGIVAILSVIGTIHSQYIKGVVKDIVSNTIKETVQTIVREFVKKETFREYEKGIYQRLNRLENERIEENNRKRLEGRD